MENEIVNGYNMNVLQKDFEREYSYIFDSSIYVKTENNIFVTSKSLGEFFGTNHYNISKYIQKGLNDGSFTEKAVCNNIYTIIQDHTDFCASEAHNSKSRGRPPKGYAFDVLHYIGMHITNSHGERYRNWVKDIVKKYAHDGYVIDKERMVDDTSSFRKLNEDIKDLRANSKIVTRQLTDLFKRAIDYGSDETSYFISRYHDILDYAITNLTSREIVYFRADSDKQNMGLITFSGDKPNKQDVTNARNYLVDDELEDFIDINNMLYVFCEFFSKKNDYTMAQLVEFLKGTLGLAKQDVLNGYGSVTSATAKAHAIQEYNTFKNKDSNQTKLC